MHFVKKTRGTWHSVKYPGRYLKHPSVTASQLRYSYWYSSANVAVAVNGPRTILRLACAAGSARTYAFKAITMLPGVSGVELP